MEEHSPRFPCLGLHVLGVGSIHSPVPVPRHQPWASGSGGAAGEASRKGRGTPNPNSQVLPAPLAPPSRRREGRSALSQLPPSLQPRQPKSPPHPASPAPVPRASPHPGRAQRTALGTGLPSFRARQVVPEDHRVPEKPGSAHGPGCHGLALGLSA